MAYQNIRDEALEQYRALPEEKNELYTRKYITMRLEEAIKARQLSKQKDTPDILGPVLPRHIQ